MKPILFSTEMVKAILADKKTQTRRVVKPKYINTHFKLVNGDLWEQENVPPPKRMPNGRTLLKVAATIIRKPRYEVNDILWVRETCAYFECAAGAGYIYRADENHNPTIEYCLPDRWKPAIHMPREAARIFLRVTEFKYEQLQQISFGDCCAEGVYPIELITGDENGILHGHAATNEFRDLWDSLYEKKDGGIYLWNKNPWVEAYTFERVDKPTLKAAADRVDQPILASAT